MISIAGVNSIDELPDLLSMIVGMVSVKAETVSLSTETWPAAGSIDTEVVTGTFEIVTMAAS